ncbi:LysR family transcriptional regulator [Azorhizobium doebereinerae]|uniref:LysR family transcriptional regulator n=1 Tax=Azorhizobium doebereinerae TaxID=281091 RepID=UPI00041608FE|nr:LysR family transcriptional regulator [Azorhizobium doebereinerae]
MLLRNLTLKQCRVFAAVARGGSMAAAAQALNVSPPAITLQMQLLQEQVGLPLLERLPSGMRLTEAGQDLLAAIQRVEVTLEEAGARLAALAGTERGTVSVGVISTAKYFAPRALAAFARTRPGVELRISVGNRAEIVAGLQQYDLDIAVMGRPPEEPIAEAHVIGDHPHVVVAPPEHPLAGCAEISPAKLEGATFLVREPGSGTRSLMERFFADAGIAPKIGMQIGSNETIKQAVIAGLGIAFISAHTVEAEVGTGRLVVLKVDGLPIVRQWYAVSLRQRQLIPAAAALRDFFITDGRGFLPLLPPPGPPSA